MYLKRTGEIVFKKDDIQAAQYSVMWIGKNAESVKSANFLFAFIKKMHYICFKECETVFNFIGLVSHQDPGL